MWPKANKEMKMSVNTQKTVEVNRGRLEYVARVVDQARQYHMAYDEAENLRRRLPREQLYSNLTTSLSTASSDLYKMLEGETR